MVVESSPETFSFIHLLPAVGGIAGIGAVLLAHTLTKRRELRSRIIAALTRERDALEARDDSVTPAFFQWHRDSVARLRGQVGALRQHQPSRWKKISGDWEAYEITEAVNFESFFMKSGDRQQLLTILDRMIASLSK